MLKYNIMVFLRHWWGYAIPWTGNLTEEKSSVQRDISYSDYRIHRRLKTVNKIYFNDDVTMYVIMMHLQRCFRQFYQELRFECSQSNYNTQH
jgi:ASC-1-like (ASCH) protein